MADFEVLENPNLRLFFFTLILILKLILVSVGGCDPSCLGGIQLDVLACECYSTIKRLREFAVVHMYLCQRQLAPGLVSQRLAASTTLPISGHNRNGAAPYSILRRE